MVGNFYPKFICDQNSLGSISGWNGDADIRVWGPSDWGLERHTISFGHLIFGSEKLRCAAFRRNADGAVTNLAFSSSHDCLAQEKFKKICIKNCDSLLKIYDLGYAEDDENKPHRSQKLLPTYSYQIVPLAEDWWNDLAFNSESAFGPEATALAFEGFSPRRVIRVFYDDVGVTGISDKAEYQSNFI